MVRTDHEDGGVLKPESEGVAKKPGTVRKSSPVSRRRKPTGKAPAPVVSEESTDDVTLEDAVTAQESAAEGDEAEVDLAKTRAGAADDVTAEPEDDDAAYVPTEGVSYRARRSSVKAPVSASPSAKKVLLPAIAGIVAAVVLIAAVVLTAVFLVGSSRIDDTRELRTGYDQFAQEVVIKMTTLNKENADSMYKFMQEHTSGRAQQQFRDSMKQATDLIRADDMKTTTTIAASAVEDADQDAGTVLVVFVWQGIAPEAPQQPDIQTFRARISITRINDDLKMTNFEWVN
ncbi:MAG: hypothetical protein LBE07_06390 [Gordonia sp. (in: high G+C Gram-positive bacteria)]|jgi:Mce-associated membrane protein|nr:hypothetical protein [Gordonia sp. (in: high G+C Gram-positive bacteria)]